MRLDERTSAGGLREADGRTRHVRVRVDGATESSVIYSNYCDRWMINKRDGCDDSGMGGWVATDGWGGGQTNSGTCIKAHTQLRNTHKIKT